VQALFLSIRHDHMPHIYLRALDLISPQTYVGDWGEELLEGRVDVADFFD
jgi:hypothetical protein